MKDKKSGENKVDELVALHYKCREFLDKPDYPGLIKFLQPIIERGEINELKTIQILLQSFKNHEHLKETVQLINDTFNKVYQKIVSSNKKSIL
jgi:hypothetical protein